MQLSQFWGAAIQECDEPSLTGRFHRAPPLVPRRWGTGGQAPQRNSRSFAVGTDSLSNLNYFRPFR